MPKARSWNLTLLRRAGTLQEQHVGLVEGHARAVDDELGLEAAAASQQIVHDEGLVRRGGVESLRR